MRAGGKHTIEACTTAYGTIRSPPGKACTLSTGAYCEHDLKLREGRGRQAFELAHNGRSRRKDRGITKVHATSLGNTRRAITQAVSVQALGSGRHAVAVSLNQTSMYSLSMPARRCLSIHTQRERGGLPRRYGQHAPPHGARRCTWLEVLAAAAWSMWGCGRSRFVLSNVASNTCTNKPAARTTPCFARKFTPRGRGRVSTHIHCHPRVHHPLCWPGRVGDGFSHLGWLCHSPRFFHLAEEEIGARTGS